MLAFFEDAVRRLLIFLSQLLLYFMELYEYYFINISVQYS